MTEDVLQRLTGRPPSRHVPGGGDHSRVERTGGQIVLAEDEPQTERLVHHEARLVGRTEHRGQFGHQRPPRHAGRGGLSRGRAAARRHQPASSCPPSWRPRLSAMRASVSSTRSPASTWSNL